MKITKLEKGISLKRPLEGGNEEQIKVVRQVLSDVKVQEMRRYVPILRGGMAMSLKVCASLKKKYKKQ